MAARRARSPSSPVRRVAWDVGAVLALLCWARDNGFLGDLQAMALRALAFLQG